MSQNNGIKVTFFTIEGKQLLLLHSPIDKPSIVKKSDLDPIILGPF